MLKLFDIPLFGRGFRPFFLLGASYGVLSILIWAAFYSGHILPPAVIPDAIGWHAHEMIYGFSMAIVAGFLLTAVANWTGGAPVRQLHLAALCLLWIAGRVVMNFELNLPAVVVYAVQLAFIPALAISLGIPLYHSRNTRNFIFLGLLGALFGFNLAFFLRQDSQFLYLALMMILMMVSLIGGRIIPAFTVAAMRRRGEAASLIPQPRMDVAALASFAVLVVVMLIMQVQGVTMAIVAAASALIHLVRLCRYHLRAALREPMLWILYLGYIWLVIGLLLLSAAALDFITLSVALHALTVGAIGSMILGMLCRVTLGHTGRDLYASPVTVLAFVLLQIAAVMRVVGAILAPAEIVLWLLVPAVLWSISFVIYLLAYAPMLLAPRPDRQDT